MPKKTIFKVCFWERTVKPVDAVAKLVKSIGKNKLEEWDYLGFDIPVKPGDASYILLVEEQSDSHFRMTEELTSFLKKLDENSLYHGSKKQEIHFESGDALTIGESFNLNKEITSLGSYHEDDFINEFDIEIVARLLLGKLEVYYAEEFSIEKKKKIIYAINLLGFIAREFTDSDLRATYVSFYSHAEAYLALESMSPLRQRWEEFYLANKMTIQDLVTGREETILSKDIWYTLWNTLGSREVSKFDVPREKFRSISQYHSWLSEKDKWLKEAEESAWFHLYRVQLNLGYEHLYRVGLSGLERIFCCYLVGRACEDVTGFSASDVYDSYERK